jgi:hypothetical protein
MLLIFLLCDYVSNLHATILWCWNYIYVRIIYLFIYLLSNSSLRGYVGVCSNDLCMVVQLGTYPAGDKRRYFESNEESGQVAKIQAENSRAIEFKQSQL